jgi:Spy/CpxP family protein refolding chaperone
MLKKSVWLGVLFFVVFLPSTLPAAGMMHGKWWHDRSIVDELELKDAEKKDLEERYIESRRKMIEQKSEVERQRFELDLLLGSPDVDRQKIMTRFDSLEQARAKLSRIRFEMLLEVRKIIGPERFQGLKSMHRDRRRKSREKY